MEDNKRMSYLNDLTPTDKQKAAQKPNLTNVIIDFSKNTIFCNICKKNLELEGINDLKLNFDKIQKFKQEHKKCFKNKIKKDMEITKDNMDELVNDIIPSIEDDNEAQIYVERYNLFWESADYYTVNDKYNIQGTGLGLKEALENYGEQYKYNDFLWDNN